MIKERNESFQKKFQNTGDSPTVHVLNVTARDLTMAFSEILEDISPLCKQIGPHSSIVIVTPFTFFEGNLPTMIAYERKLEMAFHNFPNMTIIPLSTILTQNHLNEFHLGYLESTFVIRKILYDYNLPIYVLDSVLTKKKDDRRRSKDNLKRKLHDFPAQTDMALINHISVQEALEDLDELQKKGF